MTDTKTTLQQRFARRKRHKACIKHIQELVAAAVEGSVQSDLTFDPEDPRADEQALSILRAALCGSSKNDQRIVEDRDEMRKHKEEFEEKTKPRYDEVFYRGTEWLNSL